MNSESLGSIIKRTFKKAIRPQIVRGNNSTMVVNKIDDRCTKTTKRKIEEGNKNHSLQKGFKEGERKFSLQGRLENARALALQRSESLASRSAPKPTSVLDKCGGADPNPAASKRCRSSPGIQSRLTKARKKPHNVDVSNVDVISAKRSKIESPENTLTDSFLVVSEAGSDIEPSPLSKRSYSAFNNDSKSDATVISVNNNESSSNSLDYDYSQNKSKSLASRFAKARNRLFAKKASEHLNTHSNKVAETPKSPAPRTISLEKPAKLDQVKEWLGHNDPDPDPNESISDSLLVNVDDTITHKSILYEDNAEMEWDNISEYSENKSEAESPAKSLETCVIVDTNIFIHHLSKLEELLRLKCQGKIIIYVPWMVLQELDNLKERSNLKSYALAAQRFINKQMSESDARIVGQSIDDVYEQVDLGKCPDDKILSCALQVQKKYQTAIVLTGDINLRNKAMSNNMKAYKPDEIISKLKFNKYVKAKVKLQTFLSQVIVHCCKKAFGASVYHMDVLKGSPWHFEECLKRFKKHWGTVFQTYLLRQSLGTINLLIDIASTGDIGDDDKKSLTRFKDKMSEFLFYIQDIPEFSGQARKIRSELCAVLDLT